MPARPRLHTLGRHAGERPLLNPRLLKIDILCEHESLATARALAAVEWANASLLIAVVFRRLNQLKMDQAGEFQSLAHQWLLPFLQEESAQCLLVNALAAGRTGPEREDADRLLPLLLLLYEQHSDWPTGPLTTACALGLLLRRREVDLLGKFSDQVDRWKGWDEEDYWPTRHPGKDLAALKVLLTDRVAAILGIADRKLCA